MKAGKASVKISSLKDQDIRFLFPVGYSKLMADGQLYDENGKEFTLSLKANGVVELEFEFAG